MSHLVVKELDRRCLLLKLEIALCRSPHRLPLVLLQWKKNLERLDYRKESTSKEIADSTYESTVWDNDKS